jgi:hypothetical protein
MEGATAVMFYCVGAAAENDRRPRASGDALPQPGPFIAATGFSNAGAEKKV